MAETVRVIVRCRPMNEREKGLKCSDVLKMTGENGQCSISNPSDKSSPPKSFTFDGAYSQTSTTEQIYTDIGYHLVEGVTEGYNGTIFAYGQTGSGKSFSMQGLVQPDSQRGIIPRAFEHIFETIQVTPDSKFLVHASYVEIYNEEVRDLLGQDIKRKLDLKEHPERGVYIQDLSKHICKNGSDCGRVMEKGWKNRSTGSTLMNADSSRSHSIFTIHLERCETDPKGEDRIRGAKLNLVDLAGSERQSKTGATGDRLKEATKINLSLSALGNVISALVDGKATHIPYRDSKLTRLLQDSLGGNTKTLMVACLSPADNNYEETLSTLRYANRAKNIKNKPKINEDPKDAMIREYQDEIKKLKAMLRGDLPVQLDGGNDQAVKTNTVKAQQVKKVDIEAEKQKLRKEYEKELKKARDELNTLKLSKDEVESELNRLREHYENKLQTFEQDRKINKDSEQIKSADGEHNKDLKKDDDLNIANDDDTQVSEDNSRKINGNKRTPTNQSKVKVKGNNLSKSQTKRDINGGDPNQELAVEDITSDDLNSENTSPVNLITASHNSNSLNGTSNNQKSNFGKLTSTNQNSTPANVSLANEKNSNSVGGISNNLNTNSLNEVSNNLNSKNSRVGETTAEAVNIDVTNAHEAKKRIRELEQKFQIVGGEQSGNKELVEKRQKRMKYAEERYKKLREAMALGGEDILVNIYENINEELKGTRKKFLSEQNKAAMFEQDIKDLQSEFESERREYLNSIREQDKEVKYLQALIERIQPTLRRDCNYSSLYKIRSMATWNENNNQWNLPPMTLEKTQLPAPGVNEASGMSNGRSDRIPYNGTTNSVDHLDAEDRIQLKLNSSNDADATTGFVGARARQIVQNANDIRGLARNGLGSHSSSASVLYGRDGSSPSSTWSNGRSTPTLNEMDTGEAPMNIARRPVRLQSLTPLTPVSVKQGKKSARRPPVDR